VPLGHQGRRAKAGRKRWAIASTCPEQALAC
jgi:hypothetical protein